MGTLRQLTPNIATTPIQLCDLNTHLQPIVNVKTGGIHSFEALARLSQCHDEPPAFLAKARLQHGRAEVLKHIVECAIVAYRCATSSANFKDNDLPALSINVEPEDLASDETISELIESCNALDFQISNLTIEITEHTELHLSDATIANLGRLTLEGASIAIDDFGSGYSAIALLNRISFQSVKLDRSFIHDIADNAKSQAMLFRLCTLLSDMNATIVAEGVENEKIAQILLMAGCHIQQGFHFAKPLDGLSLARSIKHLPPRWKISVDHSNDATSAPPSSNTFFDNAVDLCAIISLDGTLLKANAAFSKHLGWNHHKMINQHFQWFTHKDDVMRANAALARVATGETLHDFSMRIRTANAAKHVVMEWTVAPDFPTNTAHCIGRILNPEERNQFPEPVDPAGAFRFEQLQGLQQ